jgi:hypothetical protein
MVTRCARWATMSALALVVFLPGAAAIAAPRAAELPAKLVGVWHKTMTQAEWKRIGVSRGAGVYTAVIKKTGNVTIYLPGQYRAGCSSCPEDFETTIRTAGSRVKIGSVPACSSTGTYSWSVSGRTLLLKPVADKGCPVRETFWGGSWKH